jgi:hypothetical protein
VNRRRRPFRDTQRSATRITLTGDAAALSGSPQDGVASSRTPGEGPGDDAAGNHLPATGTSRSPVRVRRPLRACSGTPLP